MIFYSRNFKEKGANKKATFIKRKQKDIILRLRQERAQLRCMQEAYRSVCEKHQSVEMDKKKLLNEPYQMSKSKLEHFETCFATFMIH